MIIWKSVEQVTYFWRHQSTKEFNFFQWKLLTVSTWSVFFFIRSVCFIYLYNALAHFWQPSISPHSDCLCVILRSGSSRCRWGKLPKWMKTLMRGWNWRSCKYFLANACRTRGKDCSEHGFKSHLLQLPFTTSKVLT